MTTLIDLNTLEQLSMGVGTTQIQNSFELLISDLSDYLGKQPIEKNIKIKLVSENREKIRSIKILDLGVNRIQEKNSLLLEIYEKKQEFLPFINSAGLHRTLDYGHYRQQQNNKAIQLFYNPAGNKRF